MNFSIVDMQYHLNSGTQHWQRQHSSTHHMCNKVEFILIDIGVDSCHVSLLICQGAWRLPLSVCLNACIWHWNSRSDVLDLRWYSIMINDKEGTALKTECEDNTDDRATTQNVTDLNC